MGIKFLMVLLCCLLCLTGCRKEMDSPISTTITTEHQTLGEDSTPTESILPAEMIQPESPPPESADLIPIDFRHIYKGFTGVAIDDSERKEKFGEFGAQLITTEDAWSSFMATYCPGIPYSESWDFSSEYLLASITMGARPAYANSNTITGLSWYDSYFVFEFDNDPANYIYALNDENTIHYYVEVIAISKADIPPEANMYIYSSEEP